MNERKKREEEKEEGSPRWMLTLGDLNILLLTFFVLLYSMLTLEKPKEMRLKQIFQEMSLTGIKPNVGPIRTTATKEIPQGMFHSVTQESAIPDVINITGIYVRVAKLPEGTVFVIGGEFAPYKEGDWHLNDEQKLILDEIRKIMQGKRNIILIRGFTDTTIRDSVILQEGRFTSFPPEYVKFPEKRGLASHYLLAFLRANEVMKYLIQERDGISIDEDLLRPIAVAYNDPVVFTPGTEQEKAKNRRVEVIITSKFKERF